MPSSGSILYVVGNSRYSYIEGLTRYIIDPCPGELKPVAPAMDQVCSVTAQLSAVVGAAMATTAEQLPASLFTLTLPGHVIVGSFIVHYSNREVTLCRVPGSILYVSR